MNTVDLIGAAWGLGASQPGCECGPDFLRSTEMESQLKKHGVNPVWQEIIRVPSGHSDTLQTVQSLCRQLADATEQSTTHNQQFGVIGGDHTCAIGTWNGVTRTLDGPLGLLWIDAHMDAHTPASTSSGALHGMPLACLLGYGDPELTALNGRQPAVRPQDTCLVGIHSFEPEEQRLLDEMGVRVFYMTDINTRGLEAVIKDALTRVTTGTAGFGISIDLDAIDPADAPGVCTPEAGGISGAELVATLTRLADEAKPLGLEIAELNPLNDPDQRTALLTCRLAGAVLGKENSSV